MKKMGTPVGEEARQEARRKDVNDPDRAEKRAGMYTEHQKNRSRQVGADPLPVFEMKSRYGIEIVPNAQASLVDYKDPFRFDQYGNMRSSN